LLVQKKKAGEDPASSVLLPTDSDDAGDTRRGDDALTGKL